MNGSVKALVLLPLKNHLFDSLAIVIFVAVVISYQIHDRRNFANSELYSDVLDRWGAPIVQPVPSVRYVRSGSVFNNLKPLELNKQSIVVNSEMNYRKRGLVYFSGFDFSFRGLYEARNNEAYDIDLVFVFPIHAKKNQILLSDLKFLVNGEQSSAELPEESDKLIWTGRAKPNENVCFEISFKGRGLDSFTYLLDPKLRVKNFEFHFQVRGGDNYDYQPGVVPANSITQDGHTLSLSWNYPSLESGVPVGLILPSEKSYDSIISTMVRRCWAPFIFLFLGIVSLLFYRHQRSLRFYEAYLIAASYGLFFVLVAYLTAFMNFFVAYGTTLAVITILLTLYLRVTISYQFSRYVVGLLFSFLLVPTLAVILEGYTGLIYTLEIATGIFAIMFITTRRSFSIWIERFQESLSRRGESHVS